MANGLNRSVAATIVFVGAMVLGIGLAEGTLRAMGFSAAALPTLEFGWPVAKQLTDHFVPDRDTFWIPNDYAEKLAAARVTHPATVFIGDSCTEWGDYPALTVERLKTTRPALATGVKFAAAGWSTYQGLAQLRRDALTVNPRVVTIYFGWNDHWRSFGPADAESKFSAPGFWLSQHVRFYQLWMKARLHFSERDITKRPLRVPLDQYESNLREMARLVREHGATPVFITAPSSHEVGKEPQYLKEQFVANLSELVPLHTSYIEGTKRAAAESGAYLCDAASEFKKLPEPKSQYFLKDGIHLTDTGNARMADVVASCIADAMPQ